MKKKLLLQKIIVTTLVSFIGYIGFQIYNQPEKEKQLTNQKREEFNKYLDEHPFNNRNITKEDYQKIPKTDRPDLAAEQNYLMMVDPNSLTVPYEEVAAAFDYTSKKLKQINPSKNVFKQNNNSIKHSSGIFFEETSSKDPFSEAITVGGNPIIWKERGPDNVGGRTRAILWDPNDPLNRRVFAAGVTGGIWVNDNVLDPNSSWRAVNDFLASIAVNNIVADPNNPQIFYAGTGEGWFGSGAVRGIGIFKSTDAGATWNLLPSTTGSEFAYVQKIAITPSGTILLATRAVNSQGGGIFRSTDNGDSFTRVLNTRGADIEIASNGEIYASRGIFSTGSISKSSDEGLNWTDITPSGGNNPARIEIAVAPSNSNIVYAIAHDRQDNNIDWFQKSSDAGATWTNLPVPQHNDRCGDVATDITRGQAWYDLILAVSPTNPDIVLAGGVDMARTDDGGQTWRQVSEWLNCSGIENMHADQHAIVFRPGNPNEALIGNDGGIYYSPNAGIATTPTFEPRDKNYTTTQFYAVATDNVSNSDYYIGGTQDNGSLQVRNDLNFAGFRVWGGDGAFAHVDQTDRSYQLVSSQFGGVAHSSNGGISFRGLQTLGKGNFINQSDYDNTSGILYSAADVDQISKITNVNTAQASEEVAITLAIGERQISALRANTNTANRVFIGTEGGRIFIVDNANLEDPTLTEITNNISSVGNVSSIDVGTSDMELIVTYSNFGIPSVWYSTDGGTSWVNKDDTGNGLPNIPIRWALFNPNNTKQVLLATELGVWSTNDITADNPGWQPSNEGLANVRCDMIEFREADNMIVVATHGRGFYTSNIFAMDDTNAPVVTSLTPADDNNSISPLDVNLEIQFNEPIKNGTGNVNIYLASDNSLIESIDVASNQINISGSRVIINPSNNLNPETAYYIQVEATAFTDNFNNSFAGITDSTTWNFSTFDGDLPPEVSVPITDIMVNENADNQIISLTNVFKDADNDNSAITYEIINISDNQVVNVSLVESNLTLSFPAGKIGNSEIIIRGTSNGKTIDDTFNVIVNSTATALFNQPGPSNRSGRLEGVYNNGTVQNVEDFIIPGGQSWDISTVTTQAFSLGQGDLDLQNVAVIVYNDNNGSPGDLVTQQTIAANQGQIIGGATGNASLVVRLNEVISLASGTYWVSIFPTFNINFGQDATTALYAWSTSANPGNAHDGSGSGNFIARTFELLFTVDGESTITDYVPELANPIADIELSEIPNPNPTVLDLSSVFTDVDHNDSEITLEVIGNTNTSVVTPTINNQELSLTYTDFGITEITIRATSNGLTVEDSFTISLLSNIYNQSGEIAGDSWSQVFSDFDNRALESADNFIVPTNEEWDINRVNVAGRITGNPPQLGFFKIYEDNNGLPGAEIFNSGVVATKATNDSGANFSLTTKLPATLSSGTYWLSVQADQPFTNEQNRWLWSFSSPTDSGNYVRQDSRQLLSGNWAATWESLDDNGALIFNISGKSKKVLSTTNFNNTELRLLANPTSGWFEIHVGNTFTSEFKVQVYDLSGRVIKKQYFSDTSKPNFVVDLRDSSNGIYIMKISNNGKVKSFKIIKE